MEKAISGRGRESFSFRVSFEPSSSTSSSRSSNFDVFLSFRGEDLRKNFIGFLYKALKNRKINVFIDSEKLRTGEAIGPALLKAIEGSKILIPVFSKGYASSKWCLEELSHIVHCHRSKGQMVLPIFFDVEPTHVRNQTESLERPFREHEKNFKPLTVQSWREALRLVGNLKGWVLEKDVNGEQAELVELVVERVLYELSSSNHLAECKYPIGIDSHVTNLLPLLNIGSNDVQFVGICGFGGIGKTTIAKTVYNRILWTFNKHSFLSDIRDQAMQHMGLASLQNRLLKDILKTKDINVGDYHRGKKLIEQRLCREKVLIVLDDVDSQEQIDALAGELNWFGQGSRIIIITRDEHILNVAKVDKDKIYRPQELDHMESLQLFSWHAFSMDQPPKDYMQLSHEVAWYSGGLPLTLEVLGSYLSDINSKEVWKSTLQKLNEIPLEKIQERLKISYDNLEDEYQKAIFLDAASFFIGWEKETVISIWEACGYYPKSAIDRLIKRSLLKFDCGFDEDGEFSKYYLKMHDRIRDMGREIVLEQSFMEPSKRSRVWSHGEILKVLEGYKEKNMIEGMIISSALSSVYLTTDHFEMMLNLRFLDLNSKGFWGEFWHLPSTLRWFRWKNCPWNIVPIYFFHKTLIYLNLSGSNFMKTWDTRPQDENKVFQKLKVLDLSGCKYLSKSPYFSWFPYLEKLNLGDCTQMEKLDESIEQLSELKSLILSMCSSIKELPDGVGLLEKLEVLDVRNCRGLKKLPRSMARMRCLHSINLKGTYISKFPDDFSMLKNLRKLCVEGCTNLEVIRDLKGIESLEELDARGCYNLTHTSSKIHGQGTLIPHVSQQNRYSLTANDGIYNKGLILCIVLEFPSKKGKLRAMDVEISASIIQNDRTTRCYHTLRIEEVEVTSDGDIIYTHYFKGFDWFGIPLQGKDAIEILDIGARYSVKFWKILFENSRESKQRKLDQHSSAMMVADFFNWSYVNDNGGVLSFWSQPEAEGSNSVPAKELEEEEAELTRASDCKGASVEEEDDKPLNDDSNSLN